MTALSLWLDWLLALLVLTGAGFALIGAYGLAKLGDFFKRVHGPTKATTLGVGGVVLAAVLHTSVIAGSVSFKELLIAVFLFLTAPVSAHLLLQAAKKSAKVEPPPPP